ncbi:hypothetical protein SS50377_22044 [Spironucleus salmonicida]|uniref:Uncharacterized protein n=1 Tax=Spironucleus salmonicida TaxID=348837 RepID=V6LQ02_9EUKA|nr:hypothetical protein SS50377_22044 [Spironucleus salmonicida]|eukprot:EST45791.1 Hypothetical protein SS50377_14365 [Spironucleus salmonicida]
MNLPQSPNFNPYKIQNQFPKQQPAIYKQTQQLEVVNFIQQQISILIDERNTVLKSLCPQAALILDLDYYDLQYTCEQENIKFLKELTIYKSLQYDFNNCLQTIQENQLNEINFDINQIYKELEEIKLIISVSSVETVKTKFLEISHEQYHSKVEELINSLQIQEDSSSGEHSMQELLSSLGIK